MNILTIPNFIIHKIPSKLSSNLHDILMMQLYIIRTRLINL